MEVAIMEKDAFTVVGVEKEFGYRTAYEDIPQFWREHFEGGGDQHASGMFGICFDDRDGSQSFTYLIAGGYDPGRGIPAEYVMKTFPAATWAVFPCRGALPQALQDLNTQIWDEWLPNCHDYELAGNYSVEVYSDGDTSSAGYYSEIWIPVQPAGQ